MKNKSGRTCTGRDRRWEAILQTSRSTTSQVLAFKNFGEMPMLHDRTPPQSLMLAWNKMYETGSPLVDTQHKILFEKINKLEQVLAAPSIPKAEVDGLLNFLATYVTSHFKFEEQCMEHHHCPAHAQNKAAHAQFMEAFAQFSKEYAAKGPTKEVLQKLHTTASGWIQNHIMKIDIQLKSCMK